MAERIDEIVDFALDRYGSKEPIDWNDLLFRIETHFEIDLPDRMDDPEITAIKRAINKARREDGNG